MEPAELKVLIELIEFNFFKSQDLVKQKTYSPEVLVTFGKAESARKLRLNTWGSYGTRFGELADGIALLFYGSFLVTSCAGVWR